MRLFKKLRRKLNYLSEEQIRLVEQAYFTALSAHRGQKRRTGEPYITHPIAVACMLADMQMDYETLMAALMHDVIEDTSITRDNLEQEYGKPIADLVDGVSKLTQIEFHSRAEAQAENFRKMVLAMAKDIRVIIIKLADRLHNMRTLSYLTSAKRKRIATETLEIFAPIARRLGMRDLSTELEELGFQARHPHRYEILKKAVSHVRGNRKKMLHLIEKTLTEGISKIPDLPPCVVSGREKHLYSIYRKMRIKHISFAEIMDVYAFRIITDKVDTCYRILGVIHSLFKPVPERFKDYIAIPKANGYQALHTTLFGPYGLPVEVQIRTIEMDRMAVSGIAAHWLYKNGEQKNDILPHVHAQKWLNNLLELQQRAGSSLEFIENLKIDLFPDEVYVFTPKGDIKELPAGATAIDFAYAVHTDIGNQAVAVKIDRQLAPLSLTLVNGQTIEIVTSADARPNPAWLDFVTTSKARSGIKHFLKNRRKVESVHLGKQLLQKELATRGLSIRKLSEKSIQHLLQEIKLDNFEDLLEEIGLGNRAVQLVGQRFIDILQTHQNGELSNEIIKPKPLYVKGTEGTMVQFATCCYPIPGDPIVGIMMAGEGLTVHLDRCHLIAKLHQRSGQYMPLRWSEKVTGDFLVAIKIQMRNQRGILAVTAQAIADADANIEDISVTTRDGDYYWVDLRIVVRNRMHLAQVFRYLRRMMGIVKVTRSK